MAHLKKILFKLNYLYHLPALEPIIKIFSQDNSYDLAITLSHDFDYQLGIFRRQKPKEYVKKFIDKNVRIADQNEKFDVVFASDVVDAKNYQNTLICMVYHGPIFNKSVTFRELKKHKNDKYLIFVESQFAIDKLVEADCLGSSKALSVGFPKMEPIINGQINKSKILKQLRLNPNKKTILYAPTYKPTSLYELKDEIFKSTIAYNLIIKLHHYSWMGKYANRNQSRLIKKRIDQYDHAVLIPRTFFNILPLFVIADTLVSDASGAIIEFLITEKVGIIYDMNKINMNHSDKKPLLMRDKELLQESFVHITAPDQLTRAIEEAINPTKERLKIVRQDKLKYFNGCDGKASIRIKTIVDNILSKELKAKPA